MAEAKDRKETESADEHDEPLVPEWNSIEALTNDDPKVVLMGDSVLDNFYWLEHPEQHLRVVLEEMLQDAAAGDRKEEKLRCVNLAVDQMSTFDFEHRSPQKNAWGHYEDAKKRAGFKDPQDKVYYVATDRHIHSIANLKRLKNVRAVVLSIGGNDVYLNAGIQSALFSSLIPFKGYKRIEVARAFGQRLERILIALKEAVPEAQIIPVVVYHPHYHFNLLRMPSDTCVGWMASVVQKWKLQTLVTPMAQQTIQLARRYGLHVVDLSRTLDPNNDRHYGTGAREHSTSFASWSGAEPSNVSTPFIARLVIEAMKQRSSGTPTVLHGVTKGDEYLRTVVEQNTSDFSREYIFGPH